MKAFLALGVRKSVPKKLVYAKFFAFTKSDFLGLVNFDFLDLANFVAVDKFSIFPPTLSVPPVLSVLLAPSCTFYFFTWVL